VQGTGCGGRGGGGGGAKYGSKKKLKAAIKHSETEESSSRCMVGPSGSKRVPSGTQKWGECACAKSAQGKIQLVVGQHLTRAIFYCVGSTINSGET